MSGGRFPRRIKHGSCVVTIYQTPTKGYTAFTLVHYDATGSRCRLFASYAQALKAATETAANLAVGKPDVHVLTGHATINEKNNAAAEATGCLVRFLLSHLFIGPM